MLRNAFLICSVSMLNIQSGVAGDQLLPLVENFPVQLAKAPAISNSNLERELQVEGRRKIAAVKQFAATEKSLALISQGKLDGFEQLGPLMVRQHSQEEWQAYGNRILGEMQKFVDRFGEFRGLEYAHEKCASPSFCQRTYLAKFEHGVFRWVVTFYKPQDSWNVYHVHFDNNVMKLFEN